MLWMKREKREAKKRKESAIDGKPEGGGGRGGGRGGAHGAPVGGAQLRPWRWLHNLALCLPGGALQEEAEESKAERLSPCPLLQGLVQWDRWGENSIDFNLKGGDCC